MTVLAAAQGASGLAAAPLGVVLAGLGGVLVLALIVGVLVVVRRRGVRGGDASLAQAVELAPASGRVALVKLESDADGAALARLEAALSAGLGSAAPLAVVAGWKSARGLDDEARRARAAAAKAGAGVVVWGEIEGEILQLRLLAASSPAGAEAYALPAALSAPFDAAAAGLVAAVGAERARVGELAAALSPAAAALAAADASALSSEDVARLRTAQARVALARHALEGDAGALAAAVAALRTSDPRETLEPLAWAEGRALLGEALDRALAGVRDPALQDLHDRVAGLRDAISVWTELGVQDRVARAEQPLAVALLESAERDGDLRALAEADRRTESAIARLGSDSKGPEAAVLAALLGAVRVRLGEREPRPARLEIAERDLRRAMVLAEGVGDRALAASVRDDLARALARLGERDRGAERLRAAAVIYRLAAADASRDELARAQARAGLGRTLVRVGERDRDSGAVDEAVGALRAAANSFAANGAPAAAVETRRALERAERLYAELRAARAKTSA